MVSRKSFHDVATLCLLLRTRKARADFGEYHYATETVKALAEHLSVRFGIPWTFLDHPTGL